MATTITNLVMGGGINVQISDTRTYGPISFSKDKSPTTQALTHGTGAGKANKVYIAQGTIAASGNLDIDLSGSLEDPLGNAVVFTKIKSIYFELLADTLATDVTFADTVTNSVVDWAVPVVNGGHFRLVLPDADGIAVSAGTDDLLRVTNNDSSLQATYFLAITGE